MAGLHLKDCVPHTSCLGLLDQGRCSEHTCVQIVINDWCDPKRGGHTFLLQQPIHTGCKARCIRRGTEEPELVATVPAENPDPADLGHDPTDAVISALISPLLVVGADAVDIEEYHRVSANRALVPAVVNAGPSQD